MITTAIRTLVLSGWCLAAAAAAAANEPDLQAWAQAASKQHPLAGSVYEVASSKLTGLQSADGLLLVPPDGIVMLGEVHDNPAHHRVRAWLIADTLRARTQWRPAVVFEQISADQEPALEQFRAMDRQCCRLTTASDLFGLLQWDKSGWPPAETYKPLFDVAIMAGLPILAGNAPLDRVREVARKGLSPLAPADRARLRLDDQLPAPLAEALDRELAGSHCGALPLQAIPTMALAQRYRDAHLADALLAGAQQHGSAVLIAGNGHVRSDRGVPWHIRGRAPGTRVTTVLLVEVDEGRTEPADYLPRDPEGRPAADYVVFTPRAKREDPCERFRKKGSDASPPG